MINIFKHLLPSGRAWRLTTDKALRRLVNGLSSAAQDARDYIDARYLDLFPSTTTTLDEWAEQFGVESSREAVDAAWKATGGQSIDYIEGVLHAAGFDLYLHAFWVPGTEPPVGTLGAPRVRNPKLFLDSDGWIGEPIYTAGDPQVTAGAGFTAGATTQSGKGPGYLLVDGVNSYPIGETETRWPYYVYVGAAIFPSLAYVPRGRRAELEALLLKLIPAQQWIGALVTYDLDWYDAGGVILCDAILGNCKEAIPCH